MADETIVLIGISEATRAQLDVAHVPFAYRYEEFPTVEEYLCSDNVENASCLVIECDIEAWTGSELQNTARRSATCPIVIVAKTTASEPTTENGMMTVLTEPTAETLFGAIAQTLQLHSKHNRDPELEDMKSRLSRLTDPEWTVLALILQGESNRSIANELELSLRTIEARRHKIFQKTETASLPELIVLATRVQFEHGPGC